MTWGSPVERETKARIELAAYAYAYEIENQPIVDDATFDRLALQIVPMLPTENAEMDEFFRTEFSPDTGMWVHKHPGKSKLKDITKLLRKRKPMDTKQLSEAISQHLEKHTADFYDEAEMRKHLGASVIGGTCQRAIWYGFRWTYKADYVNAKGEDHRGRMMRLFNRGHKEEDRFVEWLKGMGLTVWEVNPETGEQFRVTDVAGHFGGSTDGIVEVPAGMYGLTAPTRMLLEFKTSSEKAFKKVKDDGVIIAKPQHFAQMCVYGKYYKLDYALYMMVNKNTDAIHVEVVKLQHDHGTQMVQRAAAIIGASTPPPKINESSAHWECRFCDAASICHGQASYLKNCRSCKFAQASADKSWTCTKFNNVIPTEFVPVGCDSWEEAR